MSFEGVQSSDEVKAHRANMHAETDWTTHIAETAAAEQKTAPGGMKEGLTSDQQNEKWDMQRAIDKLTEQVNELTVQMAAGRDRMDFNTALANLGGRSPEKVATLQAETAEIQKSYDTAGAKLAESQAQLAMAQNGFKTKFPETKHS